MYMKITVVILADHFTKTILTWEEAHLPFSSTYLVIKKYEKPFSLFIF